MKHGKNLKHLLTEKSYKTIVKYKVDTKDMILYVENPKDSTE